MLLTSSLVARREELLAEVESLARSDSLTGLPNRRTLDEQLPHEFARARRSQLPLCLAFLDIDHFKGYNDARGHLAGDTIAA
jgi:diguanylate cyclase (GGDEF)-like protein